MVARICAEKLSLIPWKLPIQLPAIESVEIATSGVGEIGVDVVVSNKGAVFVDVQDDITKDTRKTIMIDFVFIFPFTKQEATQWFTPSTPSGASERAALCLDRLDNLGWDGEAVRLEK